MLELEPENDARNKLVISVASCMLYSYQSPREGYVFQYVGNELQRVISSLVPFGRQSACLTKLDQTVRLCASRYFVLSCRLANFEIIRHAVFNFVTPRGHERV